MDFFFIDTNLKLLPPEETHLLDLRAAPYPDGQRIRIGLDMTPFQQKPTLEITLLDSTGTLCGSASILEPVTWKLELTLHIRKTATVSGPYLLAAILSYPELGEVDHREITVKGPTDEEEHE